MISKSELPCASLSATLHLKSEKDSAADDNIAFYEKHWLTVRYPCYHSEVGRLFEKMIYEAWGRCDWKPAMDVIETEDAYIVRLDLPGVDCNSLSIRARNRRLQVSGERRVVDDAERNVVRRETERENGCFIRIVEFRNGIQPRSVTWELQNGVLMVQLPKRENNHAEEEDNG